MREFKHSAPCLLPPIDADVGKPNFIFLFLCRTFKNCHTDGLLPLGPFHTFLASDRTQSLTFLQDFRGGQDIHSNLEVLRS